MSDSDRIAGAIALGKRLPWLLETSSPGRTMAWAILLYGALWTLVTVWLAPVVPYDAVEAWHWGNPLQAGSPKNPWMVGAVAAMARLLSLSWPACWYFCHVAAVCIGAWGCWKLCQRLITDARHAMLAVMMMTLTGTVSIDVLPYNDNYFLMMLWPWIWYGFIRAVFDDGRYWLMLGGIMGLAGMAKYTTVLYLPFMAVVVLWQGRLLATLKQPWLWAGLVLGLVLVIPNLWWLSQHDYAAFRWFSNRVGGDGAWSVIVIYCSVFYNLILILGLLWVAGWRWQWPARAESRAFLMITVIPVILLLGYFIFHGGARTEWMMPFAVPAGLALVMCMTPRAQGGYRIPLYACYLLTVLALVGFTSAKLWEQHHSTKPRNHVPALSVALNEWWHQQYRQPLVYAGGSRMGDWLGVYAPDQPQPPTRWPAGATRMATPADQNPYPNIYTPGLSDEALLAKGAMWIGEADSHCDEPNVLELDPELSELLRQRIQYHRFVFQQHAAPQARFAVCVGVLPPAEPGVSSLPPLKGQQGTLTEQ